MPVDFLNFPHAGIRHLTPYKPGKSIEELQSEKGLTKIIKLASNENPLGCSPLAQQAIKNASKQLIATYPSPIHHVLMPKLAEKLNVNKEQLFLSNGSDFIYSLLLYCFALDQEKHILTHEYAFSTYAIQAHTLNIPVRTVSVNPQWEVNIDELLNACSSQTALIFLANPNNPTGVLIPQTEIKRLLENIPEETILVLDEAYFEYASLQQNHNSIDWIETHPNLVITRTFSKLYGLAGLRIGYAITHQAIVKLLQRIQLPFTVNQMALLAASAALDDMEFIEFSLQTNTEGLLQIRQGLDALNLSYLPSACNFITFDSKNDGDLLFQYLLNQGIIIRPLHPYKMNHYLRVTIGTQEQNTLFLNALKQYDFV